LTNQLWEISSLQNWYSMNGAACRCFKSASCRTRFAPTEASTAPCLRRRKGVFRSNGEVGNWKEWILGELITFLQNWKSTKIPTWSTCTIWTIIMNALSKKKTNLLPSRECVLISHQTGFSRKIIDSKVLEVLRDMRSFPETNRKFTPWKKMVGSEEFQFGASQPIFSGKLLSCWFWGVGSSLQIPTSKHHTAGPLCPKSRWIWKSSRSGWNLGDFSGFRHRGVSVTVEIGELK